MPMYRRRYRRRVRKNKWRFRRAMLREGLPYVPKFNKVNQQIRDASKVNHTCTTPYGILCSSIPQGSDVWERERSRTFIKGVRLRIQILPSNAARQYHMKMALVVTRRLDAAWTLWPAFFRLNQNATSRTIDFTTSLNAIWGSNDFRSHAINKDQYQVIWHYRKLVPPATNNNNFSTGWATSGPKIDRYIKINRPLQYFGPGFSDSEENIWLLYWFSEDGVGAGGNIAAAPDMMRHVHTYFTN